ncbi:MAG: hydroxyacid dehydrogenase [Candidatus Sumerlaeota bacterium]
MRTKAAFICNNPDSISRVYAAGRRERVGEITELLPDIYSAEDVTMEPEELKNVEVVFSSWGMPALPAEQQKRSLPNLKAVFYAAGSVQGFARPFLENDVTVVSAWAANAIPVAEFTLAQILLATKYYWANTQMYKILRAKGDIPKGPGNYGEVIAILGAGQIGKRVIDLLVNNFHLDVIVWDPFLSEEHAEEMGVQKVDSIEEAFEQGLVVSNHLANLPETREMIKARHIASMRANATFINTGRGATVEEAAMAEVLREREDLTALLDVTFPEPPEPDTPLWALDNVHLSSHIAGSIGDEVLRMADFMIEEYENWRDDKALRFAVTAKMLETMA